MAQNQDAEYDTVVFCYVHDTKLRHPFERLALRDDMLRVEALVPRSTGLSDLSKVRFRRHGTQDVARSMPDVLKAMRRDMEGAEGLTPAMWAQNNPDKCGDFERELFSRSTKKHLCHGKWPQCFALDQDYAGFVRRDTLPKCHMVLRELCEKFRQLSINNPHNQGMPPLNPGNQGTAPLNPPNQGMPPLNPADQ